jgi:hypothetical protein
MKWSARKDDSSGLACEVCGELPHPPKVRLTLANVAAMLPIEFAVHALVVNTAMPYWQKVVVLTVTATVLVIWVAEPSVRSALRSWLHAPALRHRRRIHASESLWHLRVLVEDGPVAQRRLARSLGRAKADVLSLQLHPTAGSVIGDLIISAPDHVRHSDLVAAAADGGGHGAKAWPTTALALADGQTKALSLALRVVESPEELQHAVAELLDAKILPAPRDGTLLPDDGTVLKIPTSGPLPAYFSRPQAPFTPAESARAHRLAELAEQTELARRFPAAAPLPV